MIMAAKGLPKLIEELGELSAVAGKKLAYFTTDEHPDGAGSLKERMENEMGDVIAAMRFVSAKFGLDTEAISERAKFKNKLYWAWDKDVYNNRDGVDAERTVP